MHTEWNDSYFDVDNIQHGVDASVFGGDTMAEGLGLDFFIDQMMEPEVTEISEGTFRDEMVHEQPKLSRDISCYLNLAPPAAFDNTVKVQQNYETAEFDNQSYRNLKQEDDMESNPSVSEASYNQQEEHVVRKTKVRRQRMNERPNRDLTTISKVIFTPLKKLLRTGKCPVNLTPYFQVVDYSTNHRTLLDFELPFLFVELLDSRRPGVLEEFRDYLNSVKEEILQSARLAYGNTNTSRLITFTNYLQRIYNAYNSGEDSEGRMRILYNNVSNPKIAHRLANERKKLADKVGKMPL